MFDLPEADKCLLAFGELDVHQFLTRSDWTLAAGVFANIRETLRFVVKKLELTIVSGFFLFITGGLFIAGF